MGKSRLEPLASPLLLGMVAVLVVNDWVLKPAFHNTLTGKLSDVAGVAAFALFWAALFPRHRPHAFWMTAVAFAAWKSPLSQPLIDGWNALGPWTAGRVVDWTDLLALAVLPVVYRHDPRPVRLPRLRRVMGPAVACACVLAFAATSRIQTASYPMETQYAFDLPPDSVLQRMYDLHAEFLPGGIPPLPAKASGVDTLELTVGVPQPDGEGELRVVSISAELARTANGGSVLRPYQAWANNVTFLPEDALRSLEKQVIEPVRRNRPNEVHVAFPPIGGRPQMEPRILAPGELYSPRSQVRVSVAEPAYLALVEVTPWLDWHVIYPVEPADERLHPAGEQTLTTLCARGAPSAPVLPGEEVPACAIAKRMTRQDAQRFRGSEIPDPCPGDYDYPIPRVVPGELLLIAADAPLRRAALEETLGTWCRAHPSVHDLSLRAVFHRMDVRGWAAAVHVLRR